MIVGCGFIEKNNLIPYISYTLGFTDFLFIAMFMVVAIVRNVEMGLLYNRNI